MIIQAFNLASGKFNDWSIPSKEQAIAQIERTWGKRYDRIEREWVEGGIPLSFTNISELKNNIKFA